MKQKPAIVITALIVGVVILGGLFWLYGNVMYWEGWRNDQNVKLIKERNDARQR